MAEALRERLLGAGALCCAQSQRELAVEVGLALTLDGSSLLPLGLSKVTQIAPALGVQGECIRRGNAMPRNGSDGNWNSWSLGSIAHGFSLHVLTKHHEITC